MGEGLRVSTASCLGVGVDSLHGGPVDRAGEVSAHRVEQRLHADVFQRRTAQDRLQDALQRANAQQPADVVGRDRLLFDVFREHGVVEHGHLFEQLGPPFVGQVAMIFGNLGDLEFGPLRGFVEIQGLHLDQVDDAAKGRWVGMRPGPDGDANRHRVGGQPRFDLQERPLEIGADAVHLVDEADARHAVFVGLPPDRFALRLDPLAGAEDDDPAVEDAQRCVRPRR